MQINQIQKIWNPLSNIVAENEEKEREAYQKKIQQVIPFQKNNAVQDPYVLRLHHINMEYLGITLAELFDKLNLQVGSFLELPDGLSDYCVEGMRMFNKMAVNNEQLSEISKKLNDMCNLDDSFQSEHILDWLMQIRLSVKSLEQMATAMWEIPEHLFYTPLHGVFFSTMDLVSEITNTEIIRGANSETQYTKQKPDAFVQDIGFTIIAVEEDKPKPKV